MYMQHHMTNDTYVIVQKRESSESRFSCSSVVVSRVWSEVKQKLLWVSARFLLGRVRVIGSQLYCRLVSLLCLLTLGACHKHPPWCSTEVRNFEFISKEPCQFFVFTFLSLQFKFSVHPQGCCLMSIQSPWGGTYDLPTGGQISNNVPT